MRLVRVDPAVPDPTPEPVGDLVAYLRRKMAAADGSCSCPYIDVTTSHLARGERAYVRGWGACCPVHGLGGSAPSHRRAP